MINEKNIYLARTHQNKSHNYSFDQNTGKYFLCFDGNQKIQIHKTGKMISKFIPHASGFLNPKQRYQQALKEPSLMHYAPNMKFRKNKSLYTPMTQKFAGYTQFPYKNQQFQFPEFLQATQKKYRKISNLSKTSQRNNGQEKPFVNSFINRLKSLTQKSDFVVDSKYFDMSLKTMDNSRPTPKKKTKNCYNSRCRHVNMLKFNKQKQLDSTFHETLNKQYFNNRLRFELNKSII